MADGSMRILRVQALPVSAEVACSHPPSESTQAMTAKSCKDCGSTSRALKAPGPRCATCHRAVRNARREASWAAGILKRYGITSEQYWALYEAQGGVCWICRRATGKVRRLAVDHDHLTGWVRGLLCKPCNSILAHVRDDEAALKRAAYYLEYPIAHEVIGKVKPDDDR